MKLRSWRWSVRWSERLVPLLRNNWMSPSSRQKMEAVCSFDTGSGPECRDWETPDMRGPFHCSTCQSPVFHRGDPSIWDLWRKKCWDRFFLEYLDFFPLQVSFHPLVCCGYLVTRNCRYSPWQQYNLKRPMHLKMKKKKKIVHINFQLRHPRCVV